MPEKSTPFSREEIEELAETHPTPFYIYDEQGIRRAAQSLNSAFVDAGFVDYRNYFAVKATPNPHIVRILKEEGNGVDCSSGPELLLAERLGFQGEDIFMTSNDTPAEEYRRARELGAVINFDHPSHLLFFERHVSHFPKIGCLRYNPGNLKDGTSIMGKPAEAKFGATREQVIDGYRQMKERGVEHFAIHTMVISNCLDPEYIVDTGRILFRLINEIRAELGIIFELVNIGGGFGIPYRPEQQPLHVDSIARNLRQFHEEILRASGHPEVRVVTENGRYITGPNGYLITRVRHKKETHGKTFVGVDASMANLMRPGMYGDDAYHHITVLGKEAETQSHICNVTGPLCEDNDQFARDRQLPEIEPDDLLVIHDAGAHGAAMGFQYNGSLRCEELLRRSPGEYVSIRRAETPEDYFATVNFESLW